MWKCSRSIARPLPTIMYQIGRGRGNDIHRIQRRKPRSWQAIIIQILRNIVRSRNVITFLNYAALSIFRANKCGWRWQRALFVIDPAFVAICTVNAGRSFWWSWWRNSPGRLAKSLDIGPGELILVQRRFGLQFIAGECVMWHHGVRPFIVRKNAFGIAHILSGLGTVLTATETLLLFVDTVCAAGKTLGNGNVRP